MRTYSMRLILLSSSLFALLAGCTVGPDYKGPPDVAPGAEKAAQFHNAETGTSGYHPAAAWWSGFRDTEMSRLIATALKNSPSIALARAKVTEARASLKGSEAKLLPTVSAMGLGVHAKLGTGSAGGEFGLPSSVSTDLYSGGLDASWELDPAGAPQRGVTGARAKAEAAAAQFADAQVQLSAEVGRAYVNLRLAQAELTISRQSVALQRKTLALRQQQADQGTASQLDIARLQTQLSTTEADLPLMQAQITALSDELALLCGYEAGSLDHELAHATPIPHPPRVVKIGSPAEMLRRRPDIRAAERQLAAANEQIGAAISNYFPKIKFLGFATTSGTNPGDVLRTDTLSLIAGPMLQWNFLDFGRTKAQVAGARAQYSEAEAQYRQTVLSALQDAESSLATFEGRRSNVAKLEEASAAAMKAQHLSQDLNKAGALSLIDTLDIERQRLQTGLSLAQSQADLSTAFIALQKSLGLGWSPDLLQA
ncbi:efflux transporter outer membrane subunit, partial [Thioclava sp. BHET1]